MRVAFSGCILNASLWGLVLENILKIYEGDEINSQRAVEIANQPQYAKYRIFVNLYLLIKELPVDQIDENTVPR